jgi:hypothetical protein
MHGNLGNYLEKIKSLIGGEEDFKLRIISIIKENTQVDVGEKNIEIKNYRIYVSVNSYLKTEILLKKEILLEKIREVFPHKTLLDIL